MTSSQKPKVLWLSRLEHSLQGWRANGARRRGLTPRVAVFPGYGSTEWVRVLGRVFLTKKAPDLQAKSSSAGVRGWRSFLAVPVAHATVTVTLNNQEYTVGADQGGVIDTVLPAHLAPGWQSVSMRVGHGGPTHSQVFIVDPAIRFGVVSDVDDTVMVTALPRPMLAAWNSFVVNEHARQPVPGMSVLLDRIMSTHPGAPLIYLSTGAWNVAPTLRRFLRRNLFPAGAMLLTDWGPTHDRWFRSGKEHKNNNLQRLAEEFPNIKWLLIGDDGQHDDEIYTAFTKDHPNNVAAVAIRRLTSTEAVLAGGRTSVDHDVAAGVPWVMGSNGARLYQRLREANVIDPSGE